MYKKARQQLPLGFSGQGTSSLASSASKIPENIPNKRVARSVDLSQKVRASLISATHLESGLFHLLGMKHS
jgi:hypothetical protein